MNLHENARMTVHGRVLLVNQIVAGGWRVAAAAEAAGVSVRTDLESSPRAPETLCSSPLIVGPSGSKSRDPNRSASQIG